MKIFDEPFEVHNDAWMVILSLLSKKDFCSASSVNKESRSIANHPFLWRERLHRDFGISYELLGAIWYIENINYFSFYTKAFIPLRNTMRYL